MPFFKLEKKILRVDSETFAMVDPKLCVISTENLTSAHFAYPYFQMVKLHE
jgi:hypothetical protein